MIESIETDGLKFEFDRDQNEFRVICGGDIVYRTDAETMASVFRRAHEMGWAGQDLDADNGPDDHILLCD
jgi:hypothetical protein